MRWSGDSRHGMTKRELVWVVAVVAVIVLVGGKRAADRSERHKREVTIQHLLAVQKGLEEYAIDNAGRFPSSAMGLKVLVEPPPKDAKPQPLRWKGPYVPSADCLLDGWGRPLHYCRIGRGDPPRPYELWSYGRDNSDGGKGLDADIDVWEPDTLVP